ncbi:tRNA (guanosine(18)-2'-O)-methyltransferase [Porphyromonas levii]|uniref:RNA methyltransferase n=1 Tax=Porphyromonas levii TaxID=28114 RepID=UPI001BA618AD|nr:RNA methyltransferase [Porphyromonas levii]MBR8765720.1 tRNA (guanosine(18)-2'-O)-methyltransferase [Porphyromonas levii]MBR8783862.1 tRNA (guanosine(18)-2'-O)-methyltransferase [Porphyromonas levii]
MVSEEAIKPLSERERKIVTSLRLAKKRSEERLFVAEGAKAIELLTPSFQLRWMIASDPTLLIGVGKEARLTSQQEMKKLSSLESRHELIAVFELPSEPPFTASGLITVALEEVQNPGNLGTIIRLCDWLGIKNILCSKGCVDPFNPKVVQASMGALGNVTIYQNIDLPEFLPSHFSNIITTAMDGQDYRTAVIPPNSVIIFGNEGSGISSELLSIANNRITIPRAESSISDSLNVSLSAAILLSSFTR